jgi:2-keto-4-pentenoate hydratase/2-oxohepta-3-ene-1,7-dioic acid hydratase in catechol pathway
MGKNIGARFAGRYFDAIAFALNIHAADYLVKGDWTRAWAFDFSLPIGPWMEIEANPWQDLVISVEDAIEMASQTMTIRQGDLLVIDRTVESRQLKNDEVIRVENNGKDLLYCKIK